MDQGQRSDITDCVTVDLLESTPDSNPPHARIGILRDVTNVKRRSRPPRNHRGLHVLRTTEAHIRASAIELGIDAEEAIEFNVRGGWARSIWARLKQSVPADDPARSAIHASLLDFEPTVDRSANVTFAKGTATVHVQSGSLESAFELVRTIVPLLGHSGNGPDGPIPHEKVEEVAIRIAHSIGWMTSVAGHGRATPHDLSVPQEDFARGIAFGSEYFLLAHEMGHVAAGPATTAGRPAAYGREFAADHWAIQQLLRFDDPVVPADDGSRRFTFDTVPAPPHLTIPSATVQLWFETLRLRYLRHDISATHPSPRDRLERIRAQLLEADQDPVILEGFEAMMRVFEWVVPLVEAEHPDRPLSIDEIRDWVAVSGGDPTMVPDGTRLTTREAFERMLLEALRTVARQDSVSESDVQSIVDMAARVPQVVIDGLAAAFDGTLLPVHDPDAAAVHRLGRELPAHIEDELLREAILPD